MNEKEVEVFQRASNAIVALDLFMPFLEKERQNLVGKLKNQFRSNDHNLSAYMGIISTLVSLDDLESSMKKTVGAGKSVAEKYK